MLRRSRTALPASGAAQPQPRSDAFDVAGYDDVVPIGFGGASTVYRARQRAFDRLVAVKVLTRADPALLRRFEREKRMLGRLSGYPSIAQVFDAGVTGSGAPYLVMQYHPGGSLADLVRRGGPQPAQRVLQIGVKLAATLEAAHALGVLHRDIKPGNVMLDLMQQPVLADFGIAGWAAGGPEHTAALTYHYAAPEVVNDPTAASAGSDQYSLALTLWALLAGRSPWDDLAARRLAPLPPEVPDAAVEVLGRALAPVPQDRFPSCLRLAEELRSVQQGLGFPATLVPGVDLDPGLAAANGHAGSEGTAPTGDLATAAPDLSDAPSVPARPVLGSARHRGPAGRAAPRKALVLVSMVAAVGFSAGAAAAVIDRPQSAPFVDPVAAPTGVTAAVDGDTVVVSWDDTNGGRLPYFVYRSGSGDAALVTDPGARTAALPMLPGGTGQCFRVGVLGASAAATSDEVCTEAAG